MMAPMEHCPEHCLQGRLSPDLVQCGLDLDSDTAQLRQNLALSIIQSCCSVSWPSLQVPAWLHPHPCSSSPSVEVLPVGIIAGATIGAGILVIFFFVALVFFLYRRRKGSEYRLGPATQTLHSPAFPFRVTARDGVGVGGRKPVPQRPVESTWPRHTFLS